MGKRNCWEFTKCGREPLGARSYDLGICPTARETRLDGTHDGFNGGRACWVVARTLCDGTTQGFFGQKIRSCESCEFYQLVMNEERPHLKKPTALLSHLMGP